MQKCHILRASAKIFVGFDNLKILSNDGAALPDDGMVNGLAGDLIPNDGGLTL